MKSLFSVLAGAVIVIAKAMPAPDTPDVLSVLPNGYTVVPFSMSGAIEPGGENLTFNGTVTDILAQIQSIKPDFEWDDFQPTTGLTQEPRARIICNIPNIKYAERWLALMGHDYLKRINQPCEVDGGPRKCALLYCFRGSTIRLCNDNTSRISQSCAFLADYVLELIADLDCVWTQTWYPYHSTFMQGQIFDTDRFNLIVGKGGC
ncbi:hypothetical protein F4818DRAFT_444582 [Hypoxylon cercidicola]|nr:hypothetical protein F4818DRAFT_444582 [Hypoxylon cercidicola]